MAPLPFIENLSGEDGLLEAPDSPQFDEPYAVRIIEQDDHTEYIFGPTPREILNHARVEHLIEAANRPFLQLSSQLSDARRAYNQLLEKYNDLLRNIYITSDTEEVEIIEGKGNPEPAVSSSEPGEK
ncbi:hypothetical protein NP233_g6049 [Leucocoprinus birnbaumii]|uniref:Uncharacterized protein n=1 Tax=Leucocoprinus birnbaumii TaxID=56174 RepID=A0AAD5YU03_9AGAR|nr:hypothetical protein NP233_g6049 [Leucocoprinus birnbaumii]